MLQCSPEETEQLVAFDGKGKGKKGNGKGKAKGGGTDQGKNSGPPGSAMKFTEETRQF